jgi:hypothetical protein
MGLAGIGEQLKSEVFNKSNIQTTAPPVYAPTTEVTSQSGGRVVEGHMILGRQLLILVDIRGGFCAAGSL